MVDALAYSGKPADSAAVEQVEPVERKVFHTVASSPLGAIQRAALLMVRGREAEVARRARPRLRVLGNYAVTYLLDGGGVYVDATGRHCTLRPGDVIFVFPNLPHRYGPREHESWTEFYLVFDGPVFELWEQTGLLDRTRPVAHVEPVDYWSKRLESILGAPRREPTPGIAPPLLEVCRLQLTLAELVHAARDGRGGQPDWIARACAVLGADLAEDMDLRRLARDIGLSYETFRKRFREAVGVPPARYRAGRLIDRACELIQEGRLKDREIAERLGFCDEFYFSRRFKRLVGCTPRHFRDSLARTS